jgi:Xaa-Pro aminopeptidase
MNGELEEKTERLVAMLGREGLDAVLLNAQHNFAWLTGGGSNGIDLSRENGAASLIVTRNGRRLVLANRIEMPRMLAEELSAADFEPIVVSWQDEKAPGDLALNAVRKVLGTSARIASDIALFADVRAIEGIVAACRHQLTAGEISRFRSLGNDAGIAVRRVIDKLNPGETELDIAEKLRHELAVDGMASVVTLVAADQRISQFRHPIPTANHWGKTLLLVTCAKRQGLIVSLSRIVCDGARRTENKNGGGRPGECRFARRDEARNDRCGTIRCRRKRICGSGLPKRDRPPSPGRRGRI